MSCFVIWAHGRSGSSELARALREYAALHGEMEPFGKSMARAGIAKEGAAFEAHLHAKLMECDFIKHLWTQLPSASNEALLHNRELSRIVFLYRPNLFDVAVSTLMAKNLGNWNRIDPQAIEKPISITPTQIKNFAGALKADIQYQAKLVRASGKPVSYVRYDLLYSAAYREQFLKVVRFLGLAEGAAAAVERLAPGGKYSHDKTFARAIANWREIQPLRNAPRMSVVLDMDPLPGAPYPTE